MDDRFATVKTHTEENPSADAIIAGAFASTFARCPVERTVGVDETTYSQRNNPGLFADIVVGPGGDLWFTESGMRELGWVDPVTM